MHRSQTIRGCLWRLAGSYPLHVLGFLAIIVFALWSDRELQSASSDSSRCLLEQTWTAGDVYNWEELTFSQRSKGLWIWGDRHDEQGRERFHWETNRSEMTIRRGGRSRRLNFQVIRQGRSCVLRFDESPLPDAFYLEYYGRVSR